MDAGMEVALEDRVVELAAADAVGELPGKVLQVGGDGSAVRVGGERRHFCVRVVHDVARKSSRREVSHLIYVGGVGGAGAALC